MNKKNEGKKITYYNLFGKAPSFTKKVFFSERIKGQPISCQLLFGPLEIISISSADLSITYEINIDFTVDKKRKSITLLPNSKIPFQTLDQLYPTNNPNIPAFIHKKNDPNTQLTFGEGHFFNDRQVSITYSHQKKYGRGTSLFIQVN